MPALRCNDSTHHRRRPQQPLLPPLPAHPTGDKKESSPPQEITTCRKNAVALSRGFEDKNRLIRARHDRFGNGDQMALLIEYTQA